MNNADEFKKILEGCRAKLFTGHIRKKLALMGVSPNQYNFLRKSHFDLDEIPDELLCKIAKVLDITDLNKYFNEDLIKLIQVPKIAQSEKHSKKNLKPEQKTHELEQKAYSVLEDEYLYYKNMFNNQQEEINHLRKQLKKYQRLLDFLQKKPVEINDNNLQKLLLQHLDNPNIIEYKDAFIINVKGENLLIKSYYII